MPSWPCAFKMQSEPVKLRSWPSVSRLPSWVRLSPQPQSKTALSTLLTERSRLQESHCLKTARWCTSQSNEVPFWIRIQWPSESFWSSSAEANTRPWSIQSVRMASTLQLAQTEGLRTCSTWQAAWPSRRTWTNLNSNSKSMPVQPPLDKTLNPVRLAEAVAWSRTPSASCTTFPALSPLTMDTSFRLQSCETMTATSLRCRFATSLRRSSSWRRMQATFTRAPSMALTLHLACL